MGTILFVYGTLKRGEKSHRLLAGLEFLGTAETVAQYRLYQIGWHPGLVYDPDNGLAVQGELWAVSSCCLLELDEYEGVPDYFSREQIAITHHFEDVQAYFFNGPIPPNTISGDTWPFHT